MTIKEYLDEIPDYLRAQDGTAYKEKVKSIVHIWSQEAARGYCIASMKDAGLSKEQITAVMLYMSKNFNDISVSKAENIWKNARF